MAATTHEVTGYQIREAIKRWRIRADVAAKQFNESLWVFESDKGAKATPEQVAKNFAEADRAVAVLQQLQDEYNTRITIRVNGKDLSLALAVKLLGGAGRLENMWRKAATDAGSESRYSRFHERPQMSRKTDEEYARRAVPQDKAIRFSDEAAQYASALRSGIALGNSQKITVGQEEYPAHLFV